MSLSSDQLAVLFRHLFHACTEELESTDLTLELDLSGSPLGTVVIEAKAMKQIWVSRESSVRSLESDVQVRRPLDQLPFFRCKVEQLVAVSRFQDRAVLSLDCVFGIPDQGKVVRGVPVDISSSTRSTYR